MKESLLPMAAAAQRACAVCGAPFWMRCKTRFPVASARRFNICDDVATDAFFADAPAIDDFFHKPFAQAPVFFANLMQTAKSIKRDSDRRHEDSEALGMTKSPIHLPHRLSKFSEVLSQLRKQGCRVFSHSRQRASHKMLKLSPIARRSMTGQFDGGASSVLLTG